MFALIITIVSIALVAALALATLYYGGTAINRGGERADAAKILQEGNQLSGALELYKADHGGFPVGTSEQIRDQLLASNYLKAYPASGWEFRNDYAVRTGLSETACQTLNNSMGITTIPSCTDPAFKGRTICCTI